MAEASLTERLAAHLLRPVAESNRQRARLHLLDWLACVAGARRSPVADVARAAEPDVLTRAALLGNVLEMDDVHRTALLHPGPVVWPAALSATRDEGCDMDAMLGAAVRGYEAMIVVGATFDAYHYARWHPTSTAGGFGAAAAAASIYGMDAGATADALGNAGSTAGGLWRMRHEDVMTKALHAARAALEGLWVARLARRGFTGPRRVLEGEQGLHFAMTHAPGRLVLGDGWRMDEVSFKPWAACRHAHPAIDCALVLRERGALRPPFVLETYGDALRFCDRPDPATELDAKFSLQHAVALVAAGRDAAPADFTPAAIDEHAGLRAQVIVAEAADLTALYPAHFGARLRAGGETFELTDTRGDPERPLAAAAHGAKLRMLVAWGGLPAEEAVRAERVARTGEDPGEIVAMLEAWL